ncbi:hypothetical protein [Streptomyces sp. NBC_00525]|uniref:hypothetical protein n=1 Tax=Streptomyces sp. NBC_00525 TaxID=2903660 RepID=UPI002E7FD375|nr:hypothetical protein [Streptomyces sp. NBC_00525]WUC94946.1 hypothetical protein OG710_15775 [Streptomyces sp. NBC_00525]
MPSGRSGRPGRDFARTKEELAALLGPLLVAPDAVEAAREAHRRLAALDPPLRYRSVRLVLAGLPVEDEERARALARVLVRTGTGHLAVCTGLALLTRLGEPQDVPYLRTLGLLRTLARPVIHALDAIDRPAAAELELRGHEGAPVFRPLLAAVASGDRAAVRECLVALPGDLAPEAARRVAEAARLAELMVAVNGPVAVAGPDAGLVACAGRLLFRMTSQRDYRPEILSYPDAPYLYEAFARGAALLAPTLDHHALLLSAAQELRTGPAMLHDWGPGRREAALAELTAVLERPEWRAFPAYEGEETGVRRRLAWVRRTRAQVLRAPYGPAPTASPSGLSRLAIGICERDPDDPDTVEVRVLVDGLPVVPAYFGRGPANSPERLLDTGALWATGEPREVQLAEAYCTEGCCGALYVTVRRDGDQVVWSGWRSPVPPGGTRELPELRFEAAAYDAEVARARDDDSWMWPARRTARLIAAGLRERPDLLARWHVRFDWATTTFRDSDETLISLVYDADDGSVRQLLWRIAEDGTPPEDRAAAALRRPLTEDPRGYGR